MNNLYNMGKLNLDNGQIDQALKYFNQGMESNDSACIYEIGLMHLTGNGLTKDIEKGISYIEKAAKLYHPEALYHMGKIYYTGDCVKMDYNKSIEYLMEAFKLGHKEATNILTYIYRWLEPNNNNIVKSIKFFIMAYNKSNNIEFIDKIKELFDNNSHLIIFINEFTTLEFQYNNSLNIIKDLKTQIEFAPDGPGYIESKSHFESLVNDT